MSGSGQAKAKKKSAKKTAAELSKPAPQPSFRRARLEEFTIANVRCFAEEQCVPIRPITLLVGENSTGKTTFLGGYRAIHNLTYMASPTKRESASIPNFNGAPFAMGAFRDMVNHGRAADSMPDFQLGGKMPYRAITGGSVVAWAHVGVTYSFMESKSGANAVPYKATLVFSNGEKLDVVTGARRYGEYQDLDIIDPDTGCARQMRSIVALHSPFGNCHDCLGHWARGNERAKEGGGRKKYCRFSEAPILPGSQGFDND